MRPSLFSSLSAILPTKPGTLLSPLSCGTSAGSSGRHPDPTTHGIVIAPVWMSLSLIVNSDASISFERTAKVDAVRTCFHRGFSEFFPLLALANTAGKCPLSQSLQA